MPEIIEFLRQNWFLSLFLAIAGFLRWFIGQAIKSEDGRIVLNDIILLNKPYSFYRNSVRSFFQFVDLQLLTPSHLIGDSKRSLTSAFSIRYLVFFVYFSFLYSIFLIMLYWIIFNRPIHLGYDYILSSDHGFDYRFIYCISLLLPLLFKLICNKYLRSTKFHKIYYISPLPICFVIPYISVFSSNLTFCIFVVMFFSLALDGPFPVRGIKSLSLVVASMIGTHLARLQLGHLSAPSFGSGVSGSHGDFLFFETFHMPFGRQGSEPNLIYLDFHSSAVLYCIFTFVVTLFIYLILMRAKHYCLEIYENSFIWGILFVVFIVTISVIGFYLQYSPASVIFIVFCVFGLPSAFFDFLSFALTRVFILTGVRGGGLVALKWSIVDLFAAVMTSAILFCSLWLITRLIGAYFEGIIGHDIILSYLRDGVGSYVWFILAIFTTFLPSFVHLLICLSSICIWIPVYLRERWANFLRSHASNFFHHFEVVWVLSGWASLMMTGVIVVTWILANSLSSVLEMNFLAQYIDFHRESGLADPERFDPPRIGCCGAGPLAEEGE